MSRGCGSEGLATVGTKGIGDGLYVLVSEMFQNITEIVGVKGPLPDWLLRNGPDVMFVKVPLRYIILYEI